MINGMISILKKVNFLFLDGDIPRSLPMVYIFRNLFGLRECVLMLMTLTTETFFVCEVIKTRLDI